MLERDRLLEIIRSRKEDLLLIQQAKQAEKERLEEEAWEKERLEKKRLEKEHLEQRRLIKLAARQKRQLREIASQAARLSRWQQWVSGYRKNLSTEGFTLSDGFWRRPVNADDIYNTVTFKDAQAKKLLDTPSQFPDDLEDSAYIYVSWDRIRYEHIWYSQREENLLNLGFEQKIGWEFNPASGYWNRFFPLWVPNFTTTVWHWPGADHEEYLCGILPLKDPSPHQVLDLAGFDKILLVGHKRKQYLNNLDRLPSAQLGEPRDPLLQWMRQFSEVEIHHRSLAKRTWALQLIQSYTFKLL